MLTAAWMIGFLLVASGALYVSVRLNLRQLKGWAGEFRTTRLHLRRLDKDQYTLFEGLHLPLPGSDDTTQVDHVVVSQYGVFVIETKNISGWIFGTENQQRWTITYRSGRKTRMQNPLIQNRLHARALAKICNLDADQIHAYVFLAGDGQPKTKTKMGPNVIYRHGLVEKIRSQQYLSLSAQQVQDCIRTLSAPELQPNRTKRRQHLASLQRRHNTHD